MRRLLWVLAPLWLAGSSAWGQAMVENALGAGRAAVSAAPANGIGAAVNKLVDKGLKGMESAKPAVEVVRYTPAVAPAAPTVHYEEARNIETGTVYDELVRRFGPANLEISTDLKTKVLSYVSQAGSFQVQVTEGKVTSIQRM